MSNLPIYIFGEVLFDCFPDSPPVLGGAPFNVAWHLRAFGENPRLISAIGEDELGARIKQAMHEWQLTTKYLQVDSEHPTGVVNVRVENGEPRYDIQQDVAYDFINADLLPALEDDALLYHGSLALRNECSCNSFLALLKQKNRKYFVDVNLRPPWWRYEEVISSLNCAYVVKLNDEELRILSQNQELDLFQELLVLEVAKDFKQNNSIVNLLLTRGERGAFLIDANGEVFSAAMTPPSKPIVDTVGAGDAFAAVTLLGIQQHWDWQATLDRAQQFASFIVTQRGATCSNLELYQDFGNFWNLEN